MINLHISRLRIVGVAEDRTINFTAGLNVIAGPYGSGKTSLLELIKYALGGSGLLSGAVESGVSSVILEASLGESAFTFEREIGKLLVKVSERGDPVAILHATSSRAKGSTLASAFLLEKLGIPGIRVQRAKSTATSTKESISFWDIYRYAYVSQDDMGRSIAGHADSVLNRKRMRAFELMFGLLDEELANLETDEAETIAALSVEKKRLDDVTQFLEDAGLPSRGQALALRKEVADEIEAYRSALDGLRTQIRKSTPPLNKEREEVGILATKLANLNRSTQELRAEIEERSRLSSQLGVDIERLERGASSSSLLGPIDFIQCPRCLQTVSLEQTPHLVCYLCTQNLPEDSGDPEPDEIVRIETVRVEVDGLLAEDIKALDILDRQRTDAWTNLSTAERNLRDQTDSYVAPLFDEIASASRRLASADAEDRRLQLVSNHWDERDEIASRIRSIDAKLVRERQLLEAKRANIERRRELVLELSDTFDEIISELELAWYERARVDLKTYLPIIGDSTYKTLSGGQKTVVSVAYHLALLTIGLVHADEVMLPALLILDTPSKYLGTKDSDQVARDYRRIDAIVHAYEAPLQIIVADNDSPPPGVSPGNLIELSYDSPLIPGLDHPGPDQVTPLHTQYSDE